MTLPTFQEVWSSYLFNTKTAPKPDKLIDENLIRKNKLKANDEGEYYETKEYKDEPVIPIKITASDFMTEGAGRFVNGENFNAVKKFMAINI